MANARMRNVQTGEIRDVEVDSDEFVDLKGEVFDLNGSQRPRWEQTGDHVVRRIEDGDVREEDHGYDDKPIPPVVTDASVLAPEANPNLALTPAEIDAGLTADDKQKDLEEQVADDDANSERQERIDRARERVGREGSKSSRNKRTRQRKQAEAKEQGEPTTARAGGPAPRDGEDGD